jgi:hypothetical protein
MDMAKGQHKLDHKREDRGPRTKVAVSSNPMHSESRNHERYYALCGE